MQLLRNQIRLIGQRLLESTASFKILAIGVFVGLAVGAASILFHHLIHFVQALFLGSDKPPLEALAGLAWWWLPILPAVGGALVGPIVYLWASEARGHGVPEVMYAVQRRGGMIRPQIAAAKSAASAITIGSGGSVGQEGPVIQIGSALGSWIAQLFGLASEHRRTLVGCGAAAGVAATFNAPIAGAFFALEVVLGNFAIPALGPIVLSSVVATSVSRAYFGDQTLFDVPTYHMASWFELLPYVALGIICGLFASFFTWFLYAAEDIADSSPIPPLLRPILGGAFVGCLFWLSPHLFGSGFASIGSLLHDEIAWQMAAALIALKLVACTVTLASGGSGGVFSPILFLGATLGYVIGHGVNFIAPDFAGPPSAYALVGMGALLGAATHAPVASILILFELTADYGIILPLMLATTIGIAISRALSFDSIYTRKLHRRGVKNFGARDDLTLAGFCANDVMAADVPVVPANAPFPVVLERFLTERIETLYVVDPDGKLCGWISLHDVKGMVDEEGLGDFVVAQDLAVAPPSCFTADQPISECMQTFAGSGAEAIPVLTEGRPVGLLTRRAVMDLYDREVLRSELIGTYEHEVGAMPLPAGMRLAEVKVPVKWYGRTLGDLELRRRSGATVLGISRRGLASDAVDPSVELRSGEVLVILGTQTAVTRFEELAKGP